MFKSALDALSHVPSIDRDTVDVCGAPHYAEGLDGLSDVGSVTSQRGMQFSDALDNLEEADDDVVMHDDMVDAATDMDEECAVDDADHETRLAIDTRPLDKITVRNDSGVSRQLYIPELVLNEPIQFLAWMSRCCSDDELSIRVLDTAKHIYVGGRTISTDVGDWDHARQSGDSNTFGDKRILHAALAHAYEMSMWARLLNDLVERKQKQEHAVCQCSYI